MAGTAITYDGNSLNTTSIIVNDIDDGDAPNRSLSEFDIPRSGGSAVTDVTNNSKDINIVGKLIGTSMSNVETLRDTFLAYFNNQYKNLDIGYAGSTRRYVCTPRKPQISRPVRGSNWMAFQLSFKTKGYGQDTSATTLKSNVTIGTSPSTQTLTSIGGSAPEQMLRIQITVFSATLGTSNIITVENDTTGQVMSIERLWAVSDVLEIDYANHTVKVNGTTVEWTGPFPNFAPGTHDLIVTADFSAFSLRLTVDHYRRYL